MAVLDLIIALAQVAAAPVAPAAPLAQSPAAEPKVRLENCSARKFETTVEVEADGKPRKSRFQLCGTVGQSDADWVRTLRDAVTKINANPQLAAASRTQLVSALQAEIARLDLKPRELAPGPAASGFSILPPLPAPLPPPRTTFSGPLPASARVTLPAPRLKLLCTTAGDLGASMPCSLIERNTLILVQAEEPLKGGIALRFMRRGSARGEVPLAAMRRGQSRRIALPADLCRGVTRSQVALEIVAGRTGTAPGQVVDTRGPFELRC